MVDLAVNGYRALLEDSGETGEALRERRHQLVDARRIDRDLLDAAGVFGPAARKVHDRHHDIADCGMRMAD